MLDLKTVLDRMDTGQWFSIGYVGADKRRGDYGELYYIKRCRLLINRNKQEASSGLAENSNRVEKDPNHYEHGTRNLELPNKQVRKVHIRLIFMFNGEKLV